jgi:hypothetical protein
MLRSRKSRHEESLQAQMLEMIGTGGSGPDPERKPAKLLRAEESSVRSWESGPSDNTFSAFQSFV